MTRRPKTGVDSSSLRSFETIDVPGATRTNSREFRRDKRPTPYSTPTSSMTKSKSFTPTSSIERSKSNETVLSNPTRTKPRSKPDDASASDPEPAIFYTRKPGRIPYVLVPSSYIIEGTLHHFNHKPKSVISTPKAVDPSISGTPDQDNLDQSGATKPKKRRKGKKIPIEDQGTGEVVIPDLAQSAKSTSQCWWEDSSTVKVAAAIASGGKLTVVSTKIHVNRNTPMVMRLILIKPFLLQGITFYEPCWLLIATILLNVTSGRAARPVFFEIRKRWPTMEALSQANSDELRTLLLPLGLGDVRTQRLISFAKLYLQDPPSQDKLRPSRVTTVKGDSKYPPTSVSHLPGMGRYALDSYRIFCCQEVQPGEWKKVMPWDKELRVYLRWRWAVEGYIWDCEKGVLGPTSNDYLNELCEGTLDASCVVPPRYRL